MALVMYFFGLVNDGVVCLVNLVAIIDHFLAESTLIEIFEVGSHSLAAIWGAIAGPGFYVLSL